MGSLSVRRLDDETLKKLRRAAAREGVSMEEFARRVLRRSVAADEPIGSLGLQLFGPANGVELELPPREPHEPLDLGR